MRFQEHEDVQVGEADRPLVPPLEGRNELAGMPRAQLVDGLIDQGP